MPKSSFDTICDEWKDFGYCDLGSNCDKKHLGFPACFWSYNQKKCNRKKCRYRHFRDGCLRLDNGGPPQIKSSSFSTKDAEQSILRKPIEWLEFLKNTRSWIHPNTVVSNYRSVTLAPTLSSVPKNDKVHRCRTCGSPLSKIRIRDYYSKDRSYVPGQERIRYVCSRSNSSQEKCY